jgi:hypothetical protein
VPLLSPRQLSELCPDTLIVAQKYRQDFEKFGIHLQDGARRAEVARLLAAHQHFPALFNATLVRWRCGSSAPTVLTWLLSLRLARSCHQT